MSNLELLDRAAGATMCQILQAAGPNLVGSSAWALWNPKLAAVAFSAGALSLLASNYLCDEMPSGDGNPHPSAEGCIKITGGVGQLQVAGSASGGEFYDASDSGLWAHNDKVTEITEAFYGPWAGEWRTVLRYNTTEGPQSREQYGISSEQSAAQFKARIRPTTGTCDGTSNDPYPPSGDIYNPITYTDNITNCTYTVTFQGFAQSSEGGSVQPVLQIEGAAQKRAGGGVIGGCNFAPTIYMPSGGSGGGGDDGGGGVYIPVPDGGPPAPGGDDVPWWVPALAGAVGGAVINQVADLIDGAFAPVFEPATFTLTAPCDVDDNGDPQNRTWEFAKGTFQERMNAHQVAMMEIMQQHLDWKTPTCDCDEPTTPEGDFRTISFRSDETSPYGKSRLRKRFRYRSVSGNDLGAVVDHWKDFSFEGGPYRVRWIGGTWGTVEVWAASEAEGKRVIQHAAAEAGFDPFENGRWSTRASSSARLGVRGAMRVDTTKGFYWITARDGSDQRPIVAKT